jgi:hypothetical protein
LFSFVISEVVDVSFRKNAGGNKTDMIIPFFTLGQSIAAALFLFLNYDFLLFQALFISCKDYFLFHQFAVGRDLY